MAIRKVHYYTVEIRNVNGGRVLTLEEVRDLLNGIFNENCIDEDNGIRHLAINPNANILDRTTMDIISNDENFLFGRVGKFKDPSASLVRNIQTYEVSSVGDNQRFLEIYTYFIMDYQHGIIGYINGQSAPSVYLLQEIVKLNNANYEMTLGNIVSGETVRALVTPGSTLGKINYSYRVPDIRVLTYLGLDRNTVDYLSDTDYQTVEISIKNANRHSLTGNINIIRNLVDSFSRNGLIDKKSFKGKVPNTSTQNYRFELENYSTSIDIPTSRVENGELVQYTLDEIAEQVIARLRATYIANINHILIFANIE